MPTDLQSAGVCGIIRTSGLKVLENSDDYLCTFSILPSSPPPPITPLTTFSPDATSDSVIWTASEVTTTIVCVTLPSLRPLWNKIRGNESSSAGYRQHDDSAYGASGSYHLNSYPGKHKDVGLSYGHNRSAAIESQAIKNESDETVLLEGDGKRNIMRVQEVTVTYEAAPDDPAAKPASERQAV